jgi:aminoglycoside phosphotransferase (APT) family kinase protein
MDRIVLLVADLNRAVPAGPTLIHAEPRVDNILFEDASDGPRAWLIDWQFADRGSPMFDTAYFLAGSLTLEDRRLCEETPIARHQAAIATVAPTFGPEEARRQYDQSLPFALVTTLGAATAMPAGEHENRLLATPLQRNLAALRNRGLIPA